MPRRSLTTPLSLVARDDDASRGIGVRVISAVIIVVSILGPELLSALGTRARYPAMIAVAALLAAALHARQRLVALRSWGMLAAMFGVSLALMILDLASAQDDGATRYMLSLPMTIAGWTAMLAVLPLLPSTIGDDVRPAAVPIRATVGVPPIGVAVAMTFLFVASVHVIIMPRWTVLIDEGFYKLQSRWLSMPDFSWHVPSDLLPFFLVRHTGSVEGRLFTQYPPGWPAVLAGFRAVGLEWWAGAILAATSVWLTYLLARRVTNREAARVSAMLLALSPSFLHASSGYMAHALTIPCGVGAALLLIDAEHATWRVRALRGIGAGLLLALALSARPLTGVLLGVAILAWRVVRGSWTRETTVALLWTIVGGVIPVALTLYFNARTTGHPFQFAYKIAQGKLHGIGFGPRGFLEYDVDGRPVSMTWPYLPAMVPGHLARFLRVFVIDFLPVGMLLPLVWLARALRFRIRWSYLAGFLVFPAVHSLFWFGQPRLMSELLPFVLIGAAVLVVHVARAAPIMARWLVLASVAGTIFYDASAVVKSSALKTPWRPVGYTEDKIGNLFDTAESLHRQHGRVLFFVNDEQPNLFVPAFSRLYSLNTQGFDGDVLVARDRGVANDSLARRFPDRVPIRLVWNATTGVARVEMLPRVREAARTSPRQSDPSTTAGSTRDARRAGSQLASHDTTSSTRAVAPSTKGSVALTP